MVNKIQECGNFKKKERWRDLFSKGFKSFCVIHFLSRTVFTQLCILKKCSSSVINLLPKKFLKIEKELKATL